MANEKSITLNNLKTFKAKADATYAKKTDITALVTTNTEQTVTGTKHFNDFTANTFGTGSDANNYFQSQKFRGEGDANTYYHAVDFGYAGHNQVDFYEYGGNYNFYINTQANRDSKQLLFGINPSGIKIPPVAGAKVIGTNADGQVESHSLGIADISSLQSTLDGKVNSSSLATVAKTGSYNDLSNKPTNFLDKGSASTNNNQVVYNPVEMKKALTVPSVQGTKYTDNSGHQQSLFTLGGTVSGSGNTSQGSSSLTLYRNRAGSWDSASITFTPADGLKINNYAVGVQNWNNIPGSYILTNGDGVTKDRNGCVKLKSSGGVTSDDFIFESAYNGKLHSKMSIGPSGLVRGGWCIDNKPIATERDVAGAIGGWTLMRSVGTKVYSCLPTNIKPNTSTHAASGAPASAGKCLVDVSFFKKKGSLDGTTYPFFKTVVDVTYQGPLFELTPFAVRIGAIPYAYKWYMPRIIVSRGSMNSAWFNYMMKSLAGQADGNLVGITFEDVTVARQLLSGNLGGNGIVAPQGGLNEDGFNLFTILMELDTANDGNLAVTGCHYRIILTHPDNVLMPDE